MSRIQRKLQAQVDGILLSAIGTLVLIACAAPASPQAVIITDGARFAPAALSVRAGEQIVWRNRSPDRHSIVVEPVSDETTQRLAPMSVEDLRSGDLYHSEQWSLRFEHPGSYRFICAIHQDEDMVGALTVVE